MFSLSTPNNVIEVKFFNRKVEFSVFLRNITCKFCVNEFHVINSRRHTSYVYNEFHSEFI